MALSESEEIKVELTALRYAAGTDIGKRREENQDNFTIVEGNSFRFFIVADGMGGAKGGAIASSVATATVRNELEKEAAIDSDLLVLVIEKANQQIFEKGTADRSLTGMGTTFVGLAFTQNSMFVCNVGDSRAYRIRNNQISQLTEDHTLVQELLRTGSITEEQADQHPISHMLTRSLGPSRDVEVDCTPDDFPNSGDKFLLCSDGLYNLVADREIERIVSTHSIDDAIQELIKLANARGGTDNITIIIVEAGRGIESEQTDSALVRNQTTAEMVRPDDGTPPPTDFPGIRGESKDEAKPTGAKSSTASRSKFWILAAVITAFLGGGSFGAILFSSHSEIDVKQPLLSNARSSLFVDKREPPTVELPQVAVLPAPAIVEANNVPSPPVEVEVSPATSGIANAPTSMVSVPALPARPSKNYLLTDREINDINRRRDNLKSVVSDLTRKLSALDQPISGDVGATLQRIASDKSLLSRQFDEANKDFDRSTRRLALWYGRQKRVVAADPTNMASEVAVSSESVKKSKEAFERATWEYLSQAEKLPYAPDNKQLEAKVRELGAMRSQRLAELGVALRAAIDKEVSDADEDIAKLTAKKEELEKRIIAIDQEGDFAKALVTSSAETRLQMKNDLSRKRDIAVAELDGLNAVDPRSR